MKTTEELQQFFAHLRDPLSIILFLAEELPEECEERNNILVSAERMRDMIQEFEGELLEGKTGRKP